MALTPGQRRNAEILLGASRRPIVRKAILEAGLVESRLRNLPYGDADSVGVLQQRPSQGWKGLRNTPRAASEFVHHANRVLAGGFHGTAGELAQAVQRSAYPGRYQAKSGTADELIRTLGSGAAGSPRSVPSEAASGLSAPQGVPQGSEGLTALLGALTAPKGPPPSAGVQLPAFAAQAPVAGATPVAGGGPATPVDIGPLLAQIQTQGGDVPQAQQTAQASPTGGGDLPSSPKADRQLENILSEANHIDAAKVPYKWGGGHGGRQLRGSDVTPLDCSGAVSRVLGLDPRVSGQFERWGSPGRGKNVTVYANSGHVLMEVNGHFWGTSQKNPGGGAGWIPRSAISKQYLSRFTARHAAGL